MTIQKTLRLAVQKCNNLYCGWKGFPPITITLIEYWLRYMGLFRAGILWLLLYSSVAIGEISDIDNYRFLLKDKAEFSRKSPVIENNKPFIKDDIKINFDGKEYQVSNTLNEMGVAIYIALNRGQYDDVERLLSYYQQLSGYDVLLVEFAKAQMARANHDYAQAIFHYQTILALKPDFLRVELELARTYFEDQQNNEASSQFKRVLEKYQQQLPQSVLATISQFITELSKRNSWSGSFSVGYGYNSNINQVPGDKRQRCYRNAVQQFCYGAGLADKGTKFIYDGDIKRTFSLYQHHSLLFKAYTYGNKYDGAAEYNENTSHIRVYYQYQDAKKSFAIGPISEFKWVGERRHYYGVGVGMEAEYRFLPQFSLSTVIDHQKINYRSPYQSQDGNKSQAYITGIYALSSDAVIFGGVDSGYVNKVYDSDSYKQYGIRGGIFKDVSQYYHLLGIASYKQTRFNAPQYALGSQNRMDDEQLYLAKLSLPKYSIATMTPSISYRYRVNKSNIDALYSYQQSEIEIRLEKRF